MNEDEHDTTTDDAAAEAAFAGGFEAETPKRPEPRAAPGKDQPAETPREIKPNGKADPDYVQITRSDWDNVRTAAAKTATYDQQLSKAFGTIGNLQKVINGLRDQTPQGRKIEVSREAFADLERDFPELANSTRAALERALSGVNGNGADPAVIRRMLNEHTSEREVEVLEDAHPDWRDIVGAVDVSQQMPDPNNPFRKWLATKDAGYQRRINGTESAAVVMRAINLFQRETQTRTQTRQAQAARADARTDRIRQAVQPRGDGAAPAADATNDVEAAFESGFKNR
jgi:hypothetical protein